MVRGKTRNMPVEKIAANLNVKIHNRFDIEVVDAKTGEVKQRAKAENVILQRWWDSLSSSVRVYRIAFGSGSGSPSASDTDLFRRVGSERIASTTTNEIDRENHVCSQTHKITLTETQYVGASFTEVGISNTSDQLVTHAMLQDMNGNPISITKTDTDILNIYATVFAHWAPTYLDGGVSVSAEMYWGNYLFGFLMGSTFQGSIFARTRDTGVIGGKIPDADMTKTLSTTYDAATRSVTVKAERVPVGKWNYADGIPVVCVGSSGSNGSISSPREWHYPLLTFYADKIFPSAQIAGETIGTADGVTKDFQTKFSPAFDMQILVNGVPATGVTVGNNLPAYGNRIGKAFRFLPAESEYQHVVYGSTALPHGVFDGGGSLTNTVRGVYYNPYWQYGVTQLIHTSVPYTKPTTKIEVSDDLEHWTEIFEGQVTTTTLDVPAEYQNSKYWAATNANFAAAVSRDIPATNIHFAQPPAAGSVITANYKAKCLAKDENHVFDFEFTIYLGEYIG